MNSKRKNGFNICLVALILIISLVCCDKSNKVFLQTHIANSSKNGEFVVLLNCTTLIPPLGDVAEFQHNNKTVASVGYFNHTCIVKRNLCYINECACTPYYYMLNITTILLTSQNSFTCQLRFNGTKGHEQVFKTIIYNGLVIVDEYERIVRRGLTNDTKEIDANIKNDNPVLWYIAIVVGTVIFVAVAAVVSIKKRKACQTDSDMRKVKYEINDAKCSDPQNIVYLLSASTNKEKEENTETNTRQRIESAGSYSTLDMSLKREDEESSEFGSQHSMSRESENEESTPSLYFSSKDIISCSLAVEKS